MTRWQAWLLVGALVSLAGYSWGIARRVEWLAQTALRRNPEDTDLCPMVSPLPGVYLQGVGGVKGLTLFVSFLPCTLREEQRRMREASGQ